MALFEVIHLFFVYLRYMKTKSLSIITSVVLLCAGCTGNNGASGFWNDVDTTVTEENYGEAQDRFADFAELLSTTSLKDATKALDKLMDKLSSDEVSYLVYSDWMVSAFHSILSPVRNPELFDKCARRFSQDGIMNKGQYSPLLELAAKDKLNLSGSECSLPPLKDAEGTPFALNPGEETVFAVINLDCATCVSALNSLSNKPGRHVALCFGRTPAPVIPGWEYFYSDTMDDYFDLDAAPFWFAADGNGRISTEYSYAPEYKDSFATPQNQ